MEFDDEEIRQAIAETFRVEADEHIQTMNRLVLKLEQGGVQDLNSCLDEIARVAHTLKGASSILGLDLIQETAHCLEDLFETLRDSGREAPTELYDLLYSALDRLGVGCQNVEDPTGEDAAMLVRLQEACRRYTKEAEGSSEPSIETVNETIAGLLASGKPNGVIEYSTSPNVDQHQGTPPTAPPEPATSPDIAPISSTPEALAPPVAAAPRDDGNRSDAKPPAPTSPLREPEPAREPEPPRPSEETIRVPTRKLDSLMAQIGELLIARIRNEERLLNIRELQVELEDANKDWVRLKDVRRLVQTSSGQRHRRLVVKRQDLLDQMEQHLKTISHRTTLLLQDFSRDSMHMSILTENLQEDIKKARMLPISTILDGFHRMVRDIARREGKQAVLDLKGAETEVDKHVLELIKDPLMHVVRNAVSHGIESPARRQASGKPAQGTVLITTQQVGGQIQIDIHDDGCGIDVASVLDRAVSMGILDPVQARAMSHRDALHLVFHPGLSTKQEVTDVSGRGVGMDVVRENIQRVQGRIDIETQTGRGTRMSITLPLTLSTTKCLLVDVRGLMYAIPIHSVERIVRITPDEIRMIEDAPALVLNGVPVAVTQLAEVLGLSGEDTFEDDTKMPVVLLNAGDKRIGLIVDSLVDEQEMVVKPLGKQLLRVRNIAGGTVIGSGAVILVLNPLDIVFNATTTKQVREIQATLARRKRRAVEQKRRIVIVEDSITTRTLEKNILETAGYEVVACKDGIEAFRYLQAHPCDAVVTDINMPNLDGFALIERIRKLERHKTLPVVLVSSLGSDEDKRRGMQVGANAYIVKSEFEQKRFLDTLAALL